MKKKLVFILSSNYSGSHFLSLMLGSHTQGMHLGELKNVYKKGGFDKCYVCKAGASCELFQGVSEHEKSRLFDFLFKRADEKINFLVDASKKPRWFKDFSKSNEYDIYLIHLVRDPRALSRRWLMRFSEMDIGLRERIRQIRKNPAKIFKLLFCDDLAVCLYKWISQNREITEFIDGTGLPSKRITYKQLATNPDQTLGDICGWLGLEYEPEQKEYWRFPHHGSQKEEYQWIKSQGGGSYFDQRWRSYLTDSQIERIENHKDLNVFMKSISLGFSNEGLEHVGKE
ncbi:hypothetical protein [Porticoccus sp.]